MNNLTDFIITNIKIRKDELLIKNQKNYYLNSNCLKLLDDKILPQIDLDFINNTNNFDIIYRLSSKSFLEPYLLESNRLEGLYCMLDNINYQTKLFYKNINFVKKYKYFLIAFYIVAGQIFTDGNHRVAFHYLISTGIDEKKASNTVKMIDSCCKYKKISWCNIHEFIQKLIDNLTLIINQNNENIILKKIENLFIS